jgi:hypothetical protein
MRSSNRANCPKPTLSLLAINFILQTHTHTKFGSIHQSKSGVQIYLQNKSFICKRTPSYVQNYNPSYTKKTFPSCTKTILHIQKHQCFVYKKNINPSHTKPILNMQKTNSFKLYLSNSQKPNWLGKALVTTVTKQSRASSGNEKKKKKKKKCSSNLPSCKTRSLA